MLGSTTEKQQFQRRRNGACLHAFGINPLYTPLCTAALHHFSGYCRPGNRRERFYRPTDLEKRRLGYRERARRRSMVPLLTPPSTTTVGFEDCSASESATLLGFQRFRCAWWGGRTERQDKCGYAGGFTNRLAADPLFKSKPSPIRLKQKLPPCL